VSDPQRPTHAALAAFLVIVTGGLVAIAIVLVTHSGVV